MIESLLPWPDGPISHEHANERTLWRKLIEVIEAVNELDGVLCPMVSDVPRYGAEVRDLRFELERIHQFLNREHSLQPPFRPLHIEDGQVQDDFTLKAMQENQLRYQTPPHQAVVTPLTPSVPEAEPQEQEELAVAIAAFERSAHCVALRRPIPDGLTMNDLESRLRAAAHRAYSQPDKKRCDHIRVQLGYSANGWSTPQYVECVDCGDRMSIHPTQSKQAFYEETMMRYHPAFHSHDAGSDPDCTHRFQKQIVKFEGTTETDRYNECRDCKARLPVIQSFAAQPGKGV